MIPGVLDQALPPAIAVEGELHVLVVARDAMPRYTICSRLLDAGLRVSMAATFGVVEVLLGASESFDLLVIAQSSEEITQFGVSQLARSIDPDLPILVLEFESANSPTVVELVETALQRWPLRERTGRAYH